MKKENNEAPKQIKTFFRDMTFMEFSLFLMMVIVLIFVVVYFVFFREMDRTLDSIRIRHVPASMDERPS